MPRGGPRPRKARFYHLGTGWGLGTLLVVANERLDSVRVGGPTKTSPGLAGKARNGMAVGAAHVAYQLPVPLLKSYKFSFFTYFGYTPPTPLCFCLAAL